MMLIAIKASWFAVGTGIIFSLTSLKKEFYWIIGPVLVLFYYIGLSDINLDDESRKILFKMYYLEMQRKLHFIYKDLRET